MLKHLHKIIIAILIGFMIPMVSFATIPNNATTIAPMLKRVTPGVVNIAVEKVIPPAHADRKLFGARQLPRKTIGVGSGVIVEAKRGLIVTNAHVIKNAKLMVVTLKNGRRYRAHLIGKDDGFDIAIIKIEANNLTSIPFGDSDQLKVGDFVAAIGSPFGLTQTVTSGVISALNRSEPRIEGFQSFIQTDAPINPGNSGGALVDMNGRLIGINTAIFTPTFGSIGIGFSVPSNMVHSVIAQLLKYGKVKRGMLGVIAQNITVDLADALQLKHKEGAIVTKVVPGSPAAEAKLKTEDIIDTVNGKRIRSAAQLRNTLGLMPPGTQIRLGVIRNHHPVRLVATVGNPKAMLKQQETPFLAGMRLRNFTELESDGRNLKGILIADVSETSAGALAGLRPGDIITQANHHSVQSVEQLEAIAKQHPKQLLLKITRHSGDLFLVIEPQA